MLVACPSCQRPLRLARLPGRGEHAQCPACGTLFNPPPPKPKEYRVADEEVMAVSGVAADPERAAKKRKARALMAHGREEYHNQRRSPGWTGFGGPEALLLGLTVAFTVAAGIGILVARRAPEVGFGVAVGSVTVAGMLAFTLWVARARRKVGGE